MKKYNRLLIMVMFLSVSIVLIKAFIGFPSIDEQFYSVLPYRFYLGDKMIFNEWILAQLFSFLSIPIVSAYNAIIGSNEGIILFIRLFYVSIIMLISIITYICCKKKSIILFFACVYFFVTTPFNIMSLSYNTLAIIFFTIFLLSIYINKSSNKFIIVLSGILFSFTVLCVPMMTLVYLIYFIIVIYLKIFKKAINFNFLNSEYLLYFTLGILLSGTTFIIYVNPFSDFSAFVYSIENIFNDPSHSLSIIARTIDFFYQFVRFGNIFILANVLLLIKTYKSNNIEQKIKYMMYTLITCSIYVVICTILIPVFSKYYLYSIFNILISFIGIIAYNISSSKNKRLFYIYIASFSLPFCLNLQSNVLTSPILTGLIVSSFFSMLVFNSSVTMNDFNSKNKTTIYVFLWLLFFGFLFYKMPIHLDGNPAKIISYGAAKGIIVSDESYANYEKIYNDSTLIRENSPSNLLTIGCPPIVYLDSEMKNSSYASIFNTEDEDERNMFLERYYEIYPDKIPNFIYVCDKNGYNIVEKSTYLKNKSTLSAGILYEIGK